MQVEKTVDHITNWLKEYANNANIDGFVVGVSGGIDSAVTSSLCANTGLKVLCVEMPIHQAQSQVNRAQEHIAQLKQRFPNVSDVRVDLTSVFEEFKSVVPKVDSSAQLDLSLANTRARLRMSTLYYFAGLHKYLVAGTGNKVEDFGVGFYTKYGDGGVDLSPIADLLKSEVYALGKSLNVPESIQVAAPTDGAMKMKDKGKNSNDFTGREQEVFKIFIRLNTVNQHKMEPIPVCKIPVDLL